MRTTGKGTEIRWSRELRILPSLLAQSRSPLTWWSRKGLAFGVKAFTYRFTPSHKAQTPVDFLKQLSACWKSKGFILPGDFTCRDFNPYSGQLAQPCFWHFAVQWALDHLLEWEREGATNCTLEI